jgi:hypothetical protein
LAGHQAELHRLPTACIGENVLDIQQRALEKMSSTAKEKSVPVRATWQSLWERH